MNSYNQIWQKALKRIEIRPHSQGELAERLEKEFPEDLGLIEKVLSELKHLQLINDKNVAELFVNHWTQKNIGRIKINIEARRKKLNAKEVEAFLLESGWDEKESAKRALEPKLRVLREVDPRKRKQKLMSFLQSRGFSNGVIWEVLE